MPCPDEVSPRYSPLPLYGEKDEQKPPLAERERERERVRAGENKKNRLPGWRRVVIAGCARTSLNQRHSAGLLPFLPSVISNSKRAFFSSERKPLAWFSE